MQLFYTIAFFLKTQVEIMPFLLIYSRYLVGWWYNKLKMSGVYLVGLYSIIPVSLRRNVSYMLVGNMTYAMTQWGIIMALAKLGSAKMVGEFTLALAVTAPLIFIFDLQLRSVIATDTKNEFTFRQYLSLKGISSLLVILVLGGIVMVGNFHGQTALVIFLIGVAKLIESIIELHYGLFQKHERMDVIAKSLMIRGIISLLVISILVITTNSLVMAVLGFALSWLILFLVVERPKARQLIKAKEVSQHSIKNLFLTSLPLGIVIMMISLYTNIPRYVIEHTISTEAVGYFSALFYIVTAGNLVISAIGQTISPRLAVYFSQQEYSRFTRLVTTFVFLGGIYGFVGTILAIFIGKFILGFVYTQDYIAYHQVFVLLMISGMVMYASSFLGYSLTAMRKFKIQPYLALSWVISALILSYLLIPKFGLTGAAYVAILTSAIQLISQAITVWFYILKAKKALNSSSYLAS
jgi:O-antigen/teichoic acid export membrane protein